MIKAKAKLFALIPIVGALSVCYVDFPPPPVSVTLSPSSASVYVTESIQFTATVKNSTNGAVTWYLYGGGCSGTSCGRISDTGLYTAPPIVPNPYSVTLQAISVADPSQRATAEIDIMPAGAVPEWTWESGSETVNRQGTYVRKGGTDPSNLPGARYGAVAWIDNSDKLWFFGGRGYDSAGYLGCLNDLWNYDLRYPGGGGYTWASGSDTVDQAGIHGSQGKGDPSNVPGARYWASSWIDPGGKLWLFGGYGYDSAGNYGTLNDLWNYDPATLQWTWVSGSNMVNQAGIHGTAGTADPSNVPGARGGAASWLDSQGNPWLFGGVGFDSSGNSGSLNDLWRYDPTTLQWTWVSGSNIADQIGVYGTRDTAGPSNVPGARRGAVSWIDSSGKLWLFAGYGFDSAGFGGRLNDLWRFDPTTLEWTWVSGSNTTDQTGIYGTRGTAGPSNVPGARYGAISWIDPGGKLGLFGGNGYGSTDVHGSLNDLWKYDPATQEWAWLSGDNKVDRTGIYGHMGQPHAADVPGGRELPVCWIDSSGKLRLFGGYGYDGYQAGYLNDLWQYIR